MVSVIQYERTKDLRRMFTSAQLAEVIIREVKRQFANQSPETNLLDLIPIVAATSIRYDKGAKTAMVWDEGKTETQIDLPLNDGWYESDGNPYGVPNGKPSTRANQDALYLYRHQNRSASGYFWFGGNFVFKGRGRCFGADCVLSNCVGVELVGSKVAQDVKIIISSASSAGAYRTPTEIVAQVRISDSEVEAALKEVEEVLRHTGLNLLPKTTQLLVKLQVK